MRMYFFDVTVKVVNLDGPRKVVVYKAAHGFRELDARRRILNQFLERGFQVVRIDRVAERCLQNEVDLDEWGEQS